METTHELSFTMEGKPIVRGDDLPGEPADGAAPAESKAKTVERFGAEAAGDILFRKPAVGDWFAIGRDHKRLLGSAADASAADPFLFRLAEAIAFFGVLAIKKPAWLSMEAAGTARTMLAIVRAFEVANEMLGDEKKSSGPTGGS